MLCQLKIDGAPFEFDLQGDFFWGQDEVLFREGDNAIADTAWIGQGYTVIPLFEPGELEALSEGIRGVVSELLSKSGGSAPADFALEDYHLYALDDALHRSVVDKSRWLSFRDFHMDAAKVCERISRCLGRTAHTTNPKLNRDVVILRISRPGKLDINPPHRDGYLDIWKDTVNLWLPIAGCNEKTSLPIIPGSHYWNEKDVQRTQNGQAKIGGVPYSVPGIVDSKHGLNMIRPNPQPGQALVFTPFIVHGAAVNRSEKTRMSFELRLHVGK
jgi:hypothetical protein